MTIQGWSLNQKLLSPPAKPLFPKDLGAGGGGGPAPHVTAPQSQSTLVYIFQPWERLGQEGLPRDALEGKGPQGRLQKRLGRRLKEVAKAVAGGYCWGQMPLKPAPLVRETVAGHKQGALERGGGGPPLSTASLGLPSNRNA